MAERDSSDIEERVVVLSKAKPVIGFGIAGAVMGLAPTVLAMHGWLTGAVPLAIMVGACAWMVLFLSLMMYAINQLRSSVELSEHQLSIDRPFGSMNIRADDISVVSVMSFDRLGPMRPAWFGDAVVRVRCKDGRRAMFVIRHVTMPSWAAESFPRLFVR